MLVDVAERSLSESPFLDPTTAVQSIDRLHDGLRQLSVRVIPDGRHHDDAGNLRLTVPTMDWDSTFISPSTRFDSPVLHRRRSADAWSQR